MESELRDHLLRLAAAYMTASGLQPTTLSQRAAGDWRFLGKLHAGGRFTVRKYDEIVGWFEAHWPEGVEWPARGSSSAQQVAA
ncbi:MAG: hypothetical protein AB1592_13230 [Pseudomonadota bacterium]